MYRIAKGETMPATEIESARVVRVIVESLNGYTIGNNPLAADCTLAELRAEFARQQLPIFSARVDAIGCALVTIGRNYYG